MYISRVRSPALPIRMASMASSTAPRMDVAEFHGLPLKINVRPAFSTDETLNYLQNVVSYLGR